MDRPKDRVLSGACNISTSMSISYCIKFCNESSTPRYTYAGVELGNECYCGEAIVDYSRHGIGKDPNCLVPCSGDLTESCGATGYIAVYTSEYHS